MGLFSGITKLVGNIVGGSQKTKQLQAQADIAQAQALQASIQKDATSNEMKDKKPWYIAGGLAGLGLLVYLLSPKKRTRRR